MNNFIEYIGVEDLKKEKPSLNCVQSIFETEIQFSDDFNHCEISRIYLNLETESIKSIDSKNLNFCTLKINVSIEYMDNIKLGMSLMKNFIFYKSFYIVSSLGYLLKLHNIISNAKLLEVSKTRYYLYMSIFSIEE
ncbi:MAG: hypothetical protein ACRCWG_11945 [Sarcina sp.]